MTTLHYQSARELFKELLDKAIANQRAKIDEETRAYVVGMLHGYIENMQIDKRPLALMLKDALEDAGQMRAAKLRKLGDTSLFVSGFFPEILESGPVDSNYYISMGERAYDALGTIVSRHTKNAVFTEISRKFSNLVDLLNEISERTWATTESGIIKMCDRMTSTGSARLAVILREQGVIVPTPFYSKQKGKS